MSGAAFRWKRRDLLEAVYREGRKNLVVRVLINLAKALWELPGYWLRCALRPRLNAVQLTQIATPEFRAWFGDSKVLHRDGRPRVVYHGANFCGFSVFKPGDFGYIYATADRRYAASYARGGAVFPLYLSIQNPLDLTRFRERNLTPEDFADFLAQYGINPSRLNLWSDENTAWAFIRTTGFAWAVLSAGFDGIVMRENCGRSLAYAVFDSTQLKSAIGNSGAFSPENGDICDSPPTPSKSRRR